jgi:hypothetical protein
VRLGPLNAIYKKVEHNVDCVIVFWNVKRRCSVPYSAHALEESFNSHDGSVDYSVNALRRFFGTVRRVRGHE